MKIAVGIATRGRPLALIGVVMSLWRLRSTGHEIVFHIGVDSDDAPSQDALGMLLEGEPNVVSSVSLDRSPYLGTVQNGLIAAAHNADVVTLLTDRTFPITPGWDHILAKSAEIYPNRAMWWSCPSDPGCVMPIIPRAYIDAIGGAWSPEIFAFWHDDTWQEEIDTLVHQSHPLKAPAFYEGLRGQTTRGREFAFWGKVFSVTRRARIKQAQVIAGELGVPWRAPTAEMLDHFAERDAFHQAKAEEFEERFGDKREPGEDYMKAKANAMEIIEACDG